jgi:hypothetical protein
MIRVRLRRVLLATLAGTALFAACSSAASAEVFTLSGESCNGTEHWGVCWVNGANLQQLTGKQTIQTKLASSKLTFKYTLGEEQIEVQCTSVETAAGAGNTFEQVELAKHGVGKLHFSLELSGCSLTAPKSLAKKCAFPASKQTLAIGGTIPTETEIRLVPEAGETSPFFEFTLSNNGSETCPATFKTGSHALVGYQALTIEHPKTAETTKTASLVAKSGLKLGGAAASLEGALTFEFPGLGVNVEIAKL